MAKVIDVQASYERQRDHELSRSAHRQLPSCYTNPTSIDAWRHRRMHETIAPLIDKHPGATWMTVGDGRFGSDAYFLVQKGVDVLATSLTVDGLTEAKGKGFIDKYRLVNAEDIDLPDDSLDFVYCKESYHHFPRAYVAFYEMLRVSRIAVVLVEPQESKRRLLDWVKDFVKKSIRGDQSTEFERAGNYIFRVNVEEIKKMMKGLNYDTVVAVKPFNDLFYSRFSMSPSSGFSLGNLVTRLGIWSQNVLCASKALDYGLAAVIAFKVKPDDEVKAYLKSHGFKLHYLPKNPFVCR